MLRRGETGRRRRSILRWGAVAGCLAAVGISAEAWAHDPGISSLQLTARPGGFTARITFARRDAELLLHRRVRSPDPTSAVAAAAPAGLGRGAATAMARGLLELCDQSIAFLPGTARVAPDDRTGAIHLDVSYLPVPAARPGRAAPPVRCDGSDFMLRAARLVELGRGHRQLVTITDRNGRRLAETLLHVANDRIRLSAAAGTSDSRDPSVGGAGSIVEFVALGIEHIWSGYDHLVFLVALLLTGVPLRGAVKIVTAFTVAHSLTLGAAALGVVHLPGALVEGAIAASIVCVGLENLAGGAARRAGGGGGRRWMMAFGFGLVHGFGFAAVLEDLTSPGSAIATPLLGFNVGVEIGQLVIAAAVLPLIWRVRGYRVFEARLSPACSLLIVVAGTYWLVERTVLAF